MAYQDTNIQRMVKLIRDPRGNIGRVFPFIMSKINPYKRDLFEFFGSEKYSKPYPGHETLLKHITKKDGFFVQCGGKDGYGFDPTYYLEKVRGWKGIIIEPLPISRLCQRNRKKSVVVQSACVSFDCRESSISFMDCNFMSFVEGSIENSLEWIKDSEQAQNIECRKVVVPAKTIQAIIEQYAETSKRVTIDLFVADVEGYELQVLQGLDFSKNSPSYFLLEAQNSSRFQKIADFLKPHGYVFVEEVGEKDYLFAKNKR